MLVREYAGHKCESGMWKFGLFYVPGNDDSDAGGGRRGNERLVHATCMRFAKTTRSSSFSHGTCKDVRCVSEMRKYVD